MHFIYRIPHGESAADAYDHIRGFNESRWWLAEDNFPRALSLITHGLIARGVLMKLYQHLVVYVEDLRDIGHCEFVIMAKHQETGKYGS